MKNVSKKSLIMGGVLLLTGLCFLSTYLYTKIGSPAGDGKRKITYEIRKGVGSYRVARELAREKIISDPKTFRLYLRLTGRAGKLKAGLYDLHDGMTPSKIASVLTEGRVRMLSLTFPEGWNRKQIGDYLVKKKLVRSRREFLDITEDPRVLKKYSIPGESTEGYLFPDTYAVPYGFSARRLQNIMIERFFAQLKKIKNPTSMPPGDLYQRVILASIVEREAVRAEERPMMAQVFLNRLDKGMRLESCATIQFLLKKPRFRLYNRDLKIKSPYNTYIHRGLPPGPISSPGLAAIKAAFNPRKGPYLFFVLKPDSSHHFSVSYSEHLAAKKKFLGR